MSNNGEFSEEQSEELISHLKSGAPSDFEQLRSALNLLGHVTELPPTAMPPVLPSGITQPIPLIPVKSAKPRRTIVTSMIVVGMFASASLAAAAVTGIGPTPIVNIGHQTAKFVKGVAGAVGHVVTGGNIETTETVKNRPPQVPGLTPAPTTGDETTSNNHEGSDSESSLEPIPAIPNPLTPEARKTSEDKSTDVKSSQSREDKSKENENSHQSQTPRPENSPTVIVSPPAIPSGETEHTESETPKIPVPSVPTSLPTALPSLNSSDDSSDDD